MPNRITSILFCRRYKKVCLCVVALFVFFVTFLLNFHIHYLCSFSFVPFRKMSKTLSSQIVDGELQYLNVCKHHYEYQRSSSQIDLKLNVTDNELNSSSLFDFVDLGGTWTPSSCLPKYRINILQEIAYRVIVVEQTEEKEFNRGELFNVGFAEAQKRFPSPCYIFHDVDLIPLNLNNMYACAKMPRHLSTAVDAFNYKLPYCEIFGGAVAMTAEHFQEVNGYSNMFFGWGGEDDDLYFRISDANLNVIRFEDVAEYKMLRHLKENPNPERFRLMNTSRHVHKFEGLNSLEYSLLAYENRPLYTWMLIKL